MQSRSVVQQQASMHLVRSCVLAVALRVVLGFGTVFWGQQRVCDLLSQEQSSGHFVQLGLLRNLHPALEGWWALEKADEQHGHRCSCPWDSWCLHPTGASDFSFIYLFYLFFYFPMNRQAHSQCHCLFSASGFQLELPEHCNFYSFRCREISEKAEHFWKRTLAFQNFSCNETGAFTSFLIATFVVVKYNSFESQCDDAEMKCFNLTQAEC